MLKACWDCVAGYNANRGPAENEGAYGIVLNGDTQRAPPWLEQRENEVMFLLPKPLNIGDKVEITGSMTADPQILSVNFVTNNNTSSNVDIACQLEARFPASSENRFALRIIQNGYQEEIRGAYEDMPPSQLFSGSSFNFTFAIAVHRNVSSAPVLEMYVNGSFLEEIQLKHNLDAIRYINLRGSIEKVDKLEFTFG